MTSVAWMASKEKVKVWPWLAVMIAGDGGSHINWVGWQRLWATAFTPFFSVAPQDIGLVSV